MSSKPTIHVRQVIAGGIVVVACLLIAGQYARLIEPAATREIQAACNGLRPSPDNPIFGDMPSSQPVDFKAQNYKGEWVSLSDYRGKVVFVNFWATWCGVCKAEKSGLEEMAGEMEGDDFVILTLASNPQWNDIQEYFPNGTSLTVLLDQPGPDENLGKIAKSFGITAVPESFVIDREGRIRYYFINKRDWHSDVAKTCLRSLVDER